MSKTPGFRFPTQSLADVELNEEVPLRNTGLMADLAPAVYGAPHPKSAEHLLVWQEPFLSKDGALFIRRTYRKLPGEALTSKQIAPGTWGGVATLVAQDVAANTPVDSGLDVLESSVEAKDSQLARKKTTRVSWPVLVSKRINARGDEERVSKQKVVPTLTLPEPSLTTTEIKLEADTVDRATLTVADVDLHTELVDKNRGDVGLIPARLRAAEAYEITESIVTPASSPDALSAAILESKVSGKSRSQSLKRTVRRTGSVLPSVKDLKLGTEGELLETVEALVKTDTTPVGGFGIAADSVRDTGTGVAIRTTTQLVSGESYPVLVGRSLDLETRTPITTRRQVVEAGSALSVQSALVIEEKLQIVDKWRSVRIVTSLDSVPTSYVEYKSMSFRFPGLFFDFDPNAGGTVLQRHAFSRTVSTRVEVSFSPEGVQPSLYVIQSASWSYPLGFNASDVLTNGETFSYTASGDTVSFTVPQTSPTRSAYEQMIGTEVVVTGVCERWKGGIWRTELWKVKLV